MLNENTGASGINPFSRNTKSASGIVTGNNVRRPTTTNTTNTKPTSGTGSSIRPSTVYDRFEGVDLPFELSREEIMKGRSNPLEGFEQMYRQATQENNNKMMEIMLVNEMIKSMVAFEIERFTQFKKEKLGEGFTEDRYGGKVTNWLTTVENGTYTGNAQTDEKIQKSLGLAFGELAKYGISTITKGAIKNPYNVVEAAQGNPDVGWLLSGGAKQITDTMANLTERYGGKLGSLIGKISEGWGEWVANGAKGIGQGLRDIVPYIEKTGGKVLSYVGVPDAVLTFAAALALGIDQATGGYREKNHNLGDAAWMESLPVIGNIIAIGETIDDAIDGLAGIPTDIEAINRVERKLVAGWESLIDINDENFNKIASMEADLERLAIGVREISIEDQIMGEVFRVAPEFIERIKKAKGDGYKLTEGDIDELGERIERYEEETLGSLPSGDQAKTYISNTIKSVIRMLENQDELEKEKVKREDLFKGVKKIDQSRVNMYDLRARSITDHQTAAVDEMAFLKEKADQLAAIATAKNAEAFFDAFSFLKGDDIFGGMNEADAKQQARRAMEEHNKIVTEYLPKLEQSVQLLNKQYGELKTEATKHRYVLGTTLGSMPSYSRQMLTEQQLFNPAIGGYGDEHGSTGGGGLDDLIGTGAGGDGGGGCCMM